MTEQTGNNKPNEAEGLAFPLSGNEKLIAAGQTFRGQSDQYAELITDLADALEAAEKALTPTDDEREALIDVMVMTKLSDYAATDMSTIHQAVDAILKSDVWRFRRTEVQGEPSDAQVDAASREIDLRGFHIPPMAVRAALRAAGVRGAR